MKRGPNAYLNFGRPRTSRNGLFTPLAPEQRGGDGSSPEIRRDRCSGHNSPDEVKFTFGDEAVDEALPDP